MTFLDDIRAQGDVLASVLEAYASPTGPLEAVADLAAPGATVVFAGMGSSLSAAYPAAARLTGAGRQAVALDAGELLHYGVADLGPGSLVVLVSQSGRSAETLALARELRRAGGARVVAVVNDVRSPLASEADVVVPMLAGDEATVATRTFVASCAVLCGIADALAARGSPADAPEPFAAHALRFDLAGLVGAEANRADALSDAAARLASVGALVVVGRGPGYAAAHYAALILSETTAIPAQGITGGAFRHGPIEVCGPGVGVIVLAPSGPTRELAVRLAAETASLGSPTLLVTDAAGSDARAVEALPSDVAAGQPSVVCLPDVPETLVPVLYAVPIQHLAAQVAARRGREPGVLLRATKVTTTE